ncbi:unnamed protein product [Linum tenue]|uniref:DUF7734 domain-containing protein n=1 Tax=Linum tenue TaxID=586396 RepID=A0AAV0N6C2_9ROSI|nr:unnamed protein product [Linum tenue]
MLLIKPIGSPTGKWVLAPAAEGLIPALKHLQVTAIQRRPSTIPTTAASMNSLHKLTEKAYGPCTTTVAAAAGRRQARWDSVADEEENNEDEEYNQEIAVLEFYTQRCRGEALVVHASVDGQLVEVLIFRGFSSCLNYGTAADPSKSVIPARAVIKWIDRIKGPFDPSNIEYLEKEISWDSFKARLASSPVQ